jgi:hypothetical protein
LQLGTSSQARELLHFGGKESTQGASSASTLDERKIAKAARKSRPRASRKPEPKYAIEEIEAYIAIRDGLLAEAEKGATCELLRRVATANDFVDHCLKPARSPYQAQFLPEIDAKRERQRCETVKIRIAQLSDRMV